MNVYEGIQIRRSVRQYDKRPIEKEKIEKLLRAAMQAPSAANQQPWEFLVVENQETLEKLSKAHTYATPMKNAALGIIYRFTFWPALPELLWQNYYLIADFGL